MERRPPVAHNDKLFVEKDKDSLFRSDFFEEPEEPVA